MSKPNTRDLRLLLDAVDLAWLHGSDTCPGHGEGAAAERLIKRGLLEVTTWKRVVPTAKGFAFIDDAIKALSK